MVDGQLVGLEGWFDWWSHGPWSAGWSGGWFDWWSHGPWSAGWSGGWFDDGLMVDGQLVGLEVGLIGGLMVYGQLVGLEAGLMMATWLMV